MYPPFPPAFQVGPLSIYWYGIFIVTAIFVGALLASHHLTRRGQDGNTIWSLLLWVTIPALLGARLYALFTPSPDNPAGASYYLTHPLEILAIWQGGLHLYGALIGGCIALLIYTSVKKLPAWIYLDAIALALPLSQAIGRLASFINQEWYGPPTTLPWGVRIDPAHRVPPYDDLARYPENGLFQPLFLYEILWNLIGFLLISYLAQRLEKRLRDGSILLLYLIWYPLGRFCLEFFRTDATPFPHIPFDLVQLLSAFVALASLVLLLARPQRQVIQPAAASRKVASIPIPDPFEGEEEDKAGEGINLVVEYTFWQRYQSFLAAQDDELGDEESEGIEDMEETMEWHEANPFAEMTVEEIGENVEEEMSEEEEETIEEVLEEKEADEERVEDEEGEEEEAEDEEAEEEEAEDEEAEESTNDDDEADEEIEEGYEEAGTDETEAAEGDGNGSAEYTEDDSEGSDDGDAGDSSDE